MTKTWNDVNAIYQIYPLSFLDSGAKGTGDLRGIISKLDYLSSELAIDAIWISPFFTSPMADCGYDISDYREVNPLFGSLEDFRELLRAAHDRGIKVMIDLVPNHTSDQHKWFKGATSSLTNEYRDYYVWRDPASDGGEPNNWLSMSGGSSWQYDLLSGQYYLHTFMKNQPDLNWDNESVRSEMHEVMRFWLDMGVDGFRVDAVWPLSKDPDFKDDPINPHFEGPTGHYGNFVHANCKCGPNLHQYLQEMTDIVAGYDDRFMIFEYYPDQMIGPANPQYYDLMRLNPLTTSTFYFEAMNLPFDATVFRENLKTFYEGIPQNSRVILCFGNHDQPRMASRFGEAQARILGVLQLTLPGMPTVYYGDEIGMKNVLIDPSDLRDNFDSIGGMGGRDPERTPMRWNRSMYAGFSVAQPWLPVGPDLDNINVEDQKNDNGSFFHLYKSLLELRRANDAFRLGDICFSDDTDILDYQISRGSDTYRVMLNFTDHQVKRYLTPWSTMVCSTDPSSAPRINDDSSVLLSAFEAIIVKLPN